MANPMAVESVSSDKKYIYIEIPKDVFFKIASLLNRLDLSKMLFVCKQWKDRVLETRNSENLNRLDLWPQEVKVLNLFSVKEIKKHITLLFADEQKACSYLEKTFSPDEDFEPAFAMREGRRSYLDEQENGWEVAQSLIKECSEKEKTRLEIRKGFEAVLTLYKLHLVSLDRAQKIASVLKEKYNDQEPQKEFLALCDLQETSPVKNPARDPRFE